ncbi:hypothetical protein CAPTEDRAFT_226078 [Capitella teleta]|uniref:Fe2OG dioxygenase domain-containing protein n=1 Tax=Capitella teleta TaxID=283909 RepID=R7URP7_CAPTE|nr:hypothetical protein CAPTEDRAFT_226078 [Capitella teleta]|eukprot:ELU08828.1 hypothetical protein CAPTEDRAFT_226078 [Capitella teleta]
MDQTDLPTIDFSELVSADGLKFSTPKQVQVCRDLVRAFCSTGFACLQNHGISSEKIDSAFSKSEQFFSQDTKVKGQFTRKEGETVGWTRIGVEGFNPDRPTDLKELFNIKPEDDQPWPNDTIPDFSSTMLDFYQRCSTLNHQVLKAIAVGLDLADSEYLNTAHCSTSMTNLCLLHYPPIPEDIHEGQIRCGEHSDWGSITLLFQEGGLEIQNSDGEWWAPPCIPGSILVNVGDCLQQWTTDQLKSTRHRVSLPKDDASSRSRRSMAFFSMPNNDCVIECLDGSAKYPPVVAIDYFNKKLDEIRNRGSK